jgi:hypothetical protein
MDNKPSQREKAPVQPVVFEAIYQLLEYLDSHRLNYVVDAQGRKLFSIPEMIAADAAGVLL